MQLRLLDGGDLEKVEGGGVEEKEGDERDDPDELVHACRRGKEIRREGEREGSRGGGVLDSGIICHRTSQYGQSTHTKR